MNIFKRWPCLLTLLVMFLLTAFAFGKTWIVDEGGGPGVDFTDIQPAIAAASPGDRILVRTGSYNSFSMYKALTLIADTGHGPKLKEEEKAEIKHIPRNASAHLGGFSMENLIVHDCSGNVCIDACWIGKKSTSSVLRAYQCHLLTFSRSEAVGQSGTPSGGPGGGGEIAVPGAEFKGSTVVISESHIQGGSGGSEYKGEGHPGTIGIEAKNCILIVQSSTVKGGQGGSAWDPEYVGDGGDGAPGISLKSSSLELFGLPENIVRGGGGGSPGFASDPGESANAVLAYNSTVAYSGITLKPGKGKLSFGRFGSQITKVSPDVPVIVSTGSGQQGTFIQPELYGPAGSPFVIFIAIQSDVIRIGDLYTHLLLHPRYLFPFIADTIPSQGSIAYYLSVPHMPAWKGVPVYFQAYLDNTGGKAYLSTSTCFLIR